MYKVDKIQKENKRIHIISRVISIILYVILIPIIIFNFSLIIKSFINKNEIPDFFGYKNFVIVSGSMEPTIMKQDAVFVKEIPQDEINVGDIISFDEDGIIITHRIIDIVSEDGVIKYKTKGDNNNTADKEMITYNQIEGKYQFKINNFGVVINILKSKITLFILIIIVILMVLYENRLNKRRQIRKEKRKQLT